MRKTVMLPDIMGDTWQTWPDLPSKVLLKTLPYVRFVPEWVTLRFSAQLEAAAQALSLQLSQKQGTGNQKLPSGTQFTYAWGSLNQKTPDWLMVHISYDAVRPIEVIQLVERAIEVNTHRDMSISLLSVEIPSEKGATRRETLA